MQHVLLLSSVVVYGSNNNIFTHSNFCMKFNLFFITTVFFLNFSFAQDKADIFDVARKGTLLEAKAYVRTNPKAFNVVNQEGYSPLILACYRNNIEVAEFIIENGGDINGNSNMGTPLMAAIVKGNNEIAKILIEKKADVNLTDANGTTALIYATMFKNIEIVTLLIKKNANPYLKDNRGNSALDYAILSDNDKLIETLKTK